MSFFRETALTGLRRWLPPLALLVGVAVLLWYGATHLLAGRWLQAGLFGIAFVVFTALAHRALLSAVLPGGGGRGEFRTDEGAIAYFAREGGWVTSLDNITALSLADGDWVIAQEEGPLLHAPTDASGADDLVDAFAQLPGLQLARITAALARGGSVLIWERSGQRPRLSPTKV